MVLLFDDFVQSFLSKITEYDFLDMPNGDRTDIVDGYLKRALTVFKKNCKYDLISNMDTDNREFTIDIDENDADELLDIISEGMVVQWLKPYVYKQEILESVLNTKDFSTYSPSELLYRVRETYEQTRRNYIQMIREYSYNNGNLGDLHL